MTTIGGRHYTDLPLRPTAGCCHLANLMAWSQSMGAPWKKTRGVQIVVLEPYNGGLRALPKLLGGSMTPWIHSPLPHVPELLLFWMFHDDHCYSRNIAI